MSNKIRVLRIIEYVGDREWVEDTLRNGSIPADGIKDFYSHDHEWKNTIKSALIDKYPEILSK